MIHRNTPHEKSADEDVGTFLMRCEYEDGEEPLAAAQREFQEETGFIASAPFVKLGSVRQKTGKMVLAWGFEGDCDPAKLVSNTCEVEWHPGPRNAS